MKRNLAYVLLLMLIAVASCSFTNKNFENSDKDKLLIDLITYVLDKAHYEPKDLNDDFSVHVYTDFIDLIDPTKRYFLSSDIDDFEKYKFQIDDEIKNSSIVFFNVVYERLMLRMEDAKEMYKEVLEVPFDFAEDESVNIKYDEEAFATNKKELKKRWEKELKYATLGTYDAKLEQIEREKAEGNTEEKELQTPKDAEEKARKSTKKALDEFFEVVDDWERKDWFVQYINTIVDKFDPHTYYFAPKDKEKFDMSISGKFEGIGARLQRQTDGVKIVEVISGGPVWRDKRLEVGDEILKVGQNGDEPVSIVGMRLDDAIVLIKGEKGTIVDLTVRKVDGSIEVISIVRDVVELEESYVKSANIIKDTEKFGIINLPKFYVDFDDYTKRNAATDVAKEVERLKEEGVEGLILDLRDNGGGSLKTVVEMAGLFIKEGPIVQVKSKDTMNNVLEDIDERVQWDGPLVILVNELSASASEILAAAMQDYKRAIVIGSKQTFGKGTVQNVISLNNMLRSNEHGDLGAIKVTTQKFYRINGGSTQLEGVKSDIAVPDKYSYIDIGERAQANALKWDKIPPADYQIWDGGINFEEVVAASKKRIATNPQIKLIEDNAKWIKAEQEETTISLKYEDYKEEKLKDKEHTEMFKKMREYDSKLTFTSLGYEQELFVKDSILREKRDRWHQDLAKDVYVEEAVNVLKDLKSSSFNKVKVAGLKD